MDKKKKNNAKKVIPLNNKSAAPARVSPPTQMVVEVEEESVPVSSATVAKIEKDTAAVESAAEKLENDIDKELNKPEDVAVKSPLPEAMPQREQTKAAVREFFKPGGMPPEIPSYRKKGSGSLLLWAVVVLVVAAITGSVLTMAAKGKSLKIPTMLVKPTPTPTPEPQPTATPTPSVVRSDLKIQVLNGGGVAGAGSKMKDFLTGKGYTVSDVGNADTFDHENTEILVKSDKEAYLSVLQDDLKESYTIGSAAASLSPDSAYDAQVIIGKQ